MFDVLDSIRKKPESVRIRVAVLTAALFAVVVFAAWVIALLARRSEESRVRGAGETESSAFSFPIAFPEFPGTLPRGDEPENL